MTSTGKHSRSIDPSQKGSPNTRPKSVLRSDDETVQPSNYRLDEQQVKVTQSGVRPPKGGVLFDIGCCGIGVSPGSNGEVLDRVHLNSGYYVEVPSVLALQDVVDTPTNKEDVDELIKPYMMSVEIQHKKERC